jgi:hypothetical protein
MNYKSTVIFIVIDGWCIVGWYAELYSYYRIVPSH